MFAEFINEYGMQILYTIITAIAGYIGIVLKNVVTKYFNDKTKQSVAKTAVQFVEQVYKELHGEEKLNAALSAASDETGGSHDVCRPLLRDLLSGTSRDCPGWNDLQFP